MKSFSILALLSAISFAGICQQVDETDSTITQQKPLIFLPYFNKVEKNKMGFFSVCEKDTVAFQTYGGFSVLNTIRGNVPNFLMGPNTSPVSTSIRGEEPLLVIDGLPYSQFANPYFNTNSSEYESINVISSGNALTLFGGMGANGGILLATKTGEGYNSPTFEINSSTTQSWADRYELFFESEEITTPQFTNSVAYKQDFGNIDTRVSYTYSYLPDGKGEAEINSTFQGLRINTGFNFTSRFSARFILDDVYSKNTTVRNFDYFGTPALSESQNIKKNIQGNLALQFKILSWLKVTSQITLGKIENQEQTILHANKTTRNFTQKRLFANLFLVANKSIGNGFSLTAFSGYQSEKKKLELNNAYGDLNTKAFLAGLSLEYKSSLFIDANYRLDRFSSYSSENNTGNSYSLNTSFLFSELLDWKDSNVAKFRISIGKTVVSVNQGYPDSWPTTPSIVDYQLHPSTKDMVETGFDFAFIEDRLHFNTSYFFSFHHDLISTTNIPGGGNASTSLITNLWDVKTNGFELSLETTILKKKHFLYSSKLIWGTFNTNWETIVPINVPQPYRSRDPDWNSGFLNRFIYKNLFFSFLFDFREGGDFYTVGYSNYYPVYIFQEGKFSKLRDLSIGYQIPSSILNQKLIHDAQFSLSGRNLWTLYSSAESNVEESQGTIPQKSITLNLNITF